MFWCRNHITFECIEAKSKTFQMLQVKMRYLSNVLDLRHQIRNFLKFLCTKLRNFSNILCRDPILFECFEPKEDTLRTFAQNLCIFRIILGQNQIPVPFKCFGQKLNSVRMFFTKYDFFEGSAKKFNTFWGVLGSKSNIFPTFWIDFLYFSNNLQQNQIIPKYFGQKHDTFRMFWTKSR